jgi:hypothetical protein
VNYSVCYFSPYQLDYDYDVLSHEACSCICDEWIILVQCSSSSIVRPLKMAILAQTRCVESKSERKKKQIVALLTDCIVHIQF